MRLHRLRHPVADARQDERDPEYTLQNTTDQHVYLCVCVCVCVRLVRACWILHGDNHRWRVLAIVGESTVVERRAHADIFAVKSSHRVFLTARAEIVKIQFSIFFHWFAGGSVFVPSHCLRENDMHNRYGENAHLCVCVSVCVCMHMNMHMHIHTK